MVDVTTVGRHMSAALPAAVLDAARHPSVADLTPVLHMLRALRVGKSAMVRDLGAATRGGVPVRRYGVDLDFRRLRRSLGSRLATGSTVVSPALLGWLPDPAVPAIVELDTRGRARALTASVVLDLSESELAEVRALAAARRLAGGAGPDPAARLRLVFSAELSAFGTAVTLALPDPAKVLDAADLFGGGRR